MSQRGGKWYGFWTAVSKTRWISSWGTTTPTHGSSMALGRDEREQRPDGGDRLSTDVLPGPGPQRVVERVLVGVDEEVDRFVLGDAQELAAWPPRHPRRSRRARCPKASPPSYQWTRTMSPVAVCQSKRCVVVDVPDRRPDDRLGAGCRGDPPAGLDRGVRAGCGRPGRRPCRSASSPRSVGGGTSITSGAASSA